MRVLKPKFRTVVNVVAFAVEIAFAVAVAREIVHGVEDANAKAEDAFAVADNAEAMVANAVADAQNAFAQRICTIEAAHGLRWSEADQVHYPESQAEPSGAWLDLGEHS